MYFVGEKSIKLANTWEPKTPIVDGVITDWDMMEKVWQHMFSKELKVDSYNTMTILTESPSSTRSDRETICEMMFETF